MPYYAFLNQLQHQLPQYSEHLPQDASVRTLVCYLIFYPWYLEMRLKQDKPCLLPNHRQQDIQADV